MLLNLNFATLSGIVSTIASLWYALHLYRKQNSIQLTPIVHHATPLLEGIPKDVRNSLRISHFDKSIDDLTLCEFEIRNTGEQPIDDVRKPLELRLPKGSEILDLQIIEVRPPGRTVTKETLVSGGQPAVKFDFFVLNKHERFTVKALVRGQLRLEDLEFHIEAPRLPERLKPVKATPEKPLSEIRSDLSLGILLGSIGLSVMLYSLAIEPAPLPWPLGLNYWVDAIAKLLVITITLVGSIIAFVIGMLMVATRLPEWMSRRAQARKKPEATTED